mmetsp:Transcript_34086/g.73517  ORF Transcript_34086/g.73517 Transcript_34086/m.73517 type:complete len:80 (-) Transcript_34086:1480-1719(-)
MSDLNWNQLVIGLDRSSNKAEPINARSKLFEIVQAARKSQLDDSSRLPTASVSSDDFEAVSVSEHGATESDEPPATSAG